MIEEHPKDTGGRRLRSMVAIGAKSILFPCVIIIAMMTGCASQSAFKTGCQLLEQHQYDDAITKLTEAVEKWPESFGENEKYIATLSRAKVSGARWHLDQARECQEATDLGLAEAHLVKAIGYDPTLTECNPLLSDVRESIENAEAIRRKALALGEEGKWDDAVQVIRTSLSRYRSLPNGETDHLRLCAGASEYHLAHAENHLAKDEWDAAESSARRSIDYKPNDGARAVLAEVGKRREADRLVREAKECENKNDFRTALEKLEAAKRLHPNRRGLPEDITRVKQSLCDQLIRLAQGFSAKGTHAAALRSLIESKAILADYGDIDKRIREERLALAAQHVEMAKRKADKDAMGSALCHYLSALGHDPEDSTAAQGVQACLTHFRRKTKYNIGLVGFQVSQKHAEVGSRFEAAALQQLLRVKPLNVSIVDRADLKAILAEQDLSLTDMVDPKFRIPGGKLQSIDGLLIGQVISYDVFRDQSSTWGESTYQAGMKLVANPQYARATELVRQAERELTEARQELGTANAGAGLAAMGRSNDPMARLIGGLSAAGGQMARQKVAAAQERLQSAQLQLAQTPAQVAVPNILRHRYPIYRVTATSKCTGSLKLLDSLTGEVLVAEPVVGSSSESDRHVKGDVQRNVPEDPVDLPDDAFMRERALAEALQKLDESVQRAVSRHGMRFSIMAERAMAAKRADEAIDHAMCYLLSYPTGGTNTSAMSEIVVSSFEDEADLIQAMNLLRQRCRVLLTPGWLPASVDDGKDGVRILRFDDTELSRRIGTPCVLTAIDGMPVSSVRQLRAILSGYGAGEDVKLGVESKEPQSSSITVTLIEKKD